MDDFGLLVFLLPPADCQGYNVSMNTPALAALGIQLGALCLLGKLSLSGVNILSLPSTFRFFKFFTGSPLLGVGVDTMQA